MGFYKCFKSNLAALGLPAPETLFGTVADKTMEAACTSIWTPSPPHCTWRSMTG